MKTLWRLISSLSQNAISEHSPEAHPCRHESIAGQHLLSIADGSHLELLNLLLLHLDILQLIFQGLRYFGDAVPPGIVLVHCPGVAHVDVINFLPLAANGILNVLLPAGQLLKAGLQLCCERAGSALGGGFQGPANCLTSTLHLQEV